MCGKLTGNNSAKNADFRDASETAINSMIGGIAEEVGEAASRLVGTVFGTNKTPQSQIPEVMRRGGVNSECSNLRSRNMPY